LRDVSNIVFAVDDSEVIINDVRHTILAAVSFNDPTAAVDRMAALRETLGVAPDFEFKWNQRVGDATNRHTISDAFQGILSESIGLLTIAEGTDRQQAAELLTAQIADLIDGSILPFVIFDEGIVRDEVSFRRHLLAGSSTLRRTQVSSARSFANDLVQCADLFAGFHNLKVRIAIGQTTDRLIQFDDGRGEDEMPLSALLEMAFRYSLWGPETFEVDPEWNYENGPPPGRYKEAEGYGLRIHSSIDREVRAMLYDEVGRAYTGCWS
jgi:hypothetical protein